MRYLFIASMMFIGCKEEKEKEKTLPFTQDQLMVVWENGYNKGALNVLQNLNYVDSQWKHDSATFRDQFLNTYKENK